MKYNQYNQPIGESLPAFKGAEPPRAISMTGRFCRLEKLDPERHAKVLFDALCDPQHEANWTYLPYGPFDEYAAFYELLEQQSKMLDPLFFSIIDNQTNSAIGITSYLRIEPNTGVIEVGNIHFSAQLQKNTACN